jgi:hypothetical protein
VNNNRPSSTRLDSNCSFSTPQARSIISRSSPRPGLTQNLNQHSTPEPSTRQPLACISCLLSALCTRPSPALSIQPLPCSPPISKLQPCCFGRPATPSQLTAHLEKQPARASSSISASTSIWHQLQLERRLPCPRSSLSLHCWTLFQPTCPTSCLPGKLDHLLHLPVHL